MEIYAETDSKLQHNGPGWEAVEIAVKTSTPADNLKNKPGFLWLGGFKSDMVGSKAQSMVEQAAKLGVASTRFDYSGHGVSGGEFVKGSISRWVDESLHVILEKTTGQQILVGSSMGGWIALRLSQILQERGDADRIAGLLLIAPAPDFTKELMEPEFSAHQRGLLEEQGYFEEPTPYSDEPNIITRALIEDGRDNLVLNSNFTLNAPIRILQGMEDPDVPYTHALRLMEVLPDNNVSITLVKDGDHRLSRAQDIALLQRTMAEMIE